jgi:hypothetical protein
VPRMRTAGGCWAHANDPKAATTVTETSTRRSKDEIPGIALLPQTCSTEGKHRDAQGIPG